MVSKETILTLLQLVALTLPAVAIVLDLYMRDRNTWELPDGPSATLHGLRFTFLWFILSGILLLSALLIYGWAPTLLVNSLVIISVLGIIIGLSTFALAFIVNPDFLQNDYPITWVYKNLYHRLRDRIQNHI